MNDILAHDVSIVVVGNLNPKIFSPSWLQVVGLIDQIDAENAEVGVIHPQITSFKVSQFSIQVQPNTFTIATTEEPFITLADWIEVIFGEALNHTPLQQVGINYSVHFAAKSLEQRHALGRLLAPIGPWGEWGETLETQDIKQLGGLKSLSMMQTFVPGRTRGYRQVQLEPSVRQDIVERGVGIYMNVNDHFEVSTVEDGVNSKACVDWVRSYFDQSVQTSKSIVSHIQQLTASL